MSRSFIIHILVLAQASSLDVALTRDTLKRAGRAAKELSAELLTAENTSVTLDDGTVVVPTTTAQTEQPEALIIVAGSHPEAAQEQKAINMIRRLTRSSAYVVGIGYGALIMAKANTLDGRRATCHHDHLPMAKEHFHKVQFSEQLYVIDGKRITCAGHFAIVDMLLHLLETWISSSIADPVIDALLTPPPRPATTPQRLHTFNAARSTLDPRLDKAIAIMRDRIEMPLGLEDIAARVDLSVRQLQNLWRTKLGTSHQEYYLKLRLDYARSLLLHSDMQISEIALASGFSSTAIFSRAFRRQTDLSAREFRNQNRDNFFPILPIGSLRTLGTIIDRHAGFLYRNLNDRVYSVLFVTRGIERMLGYSPSEFMSKPGRNMASIIHPDDLPTMQCNVDQAVEMKQNWDIEFRYIHRNGQPVWVHEVGSGVFNRSGRLLYVEGIIIRNLSPPDRYRDTMFQD